MATGAVDRTNQNAVLARRLGDSSKQISEIVGVITSVAKQTNLLALNATIEAARVGEAGKGFAVVAGEVKELAGGTSDATESITEQIGDVQRLIDELVGALGETTEMMELVNAHQASISASVEQQGAASQQLAETVNHAAGTSQSAIAALSL